MHRIDGPGATVDNKFTEGDPVSAVPATEVTGDWLNAVQEEIAAVIVSAGLTLNKANNAQLLAAITQKITAAIPASPPDASTTLKGIVELATDAETQAGTDAQRAVTPASLSACTGTESRAGILQLATQAEAQAGTESSKAISVIRVWQTITSRFATQAQVNAGTDDTTMVTPLKMRAGFAASFGVNGYLAFPTWLGGLILNWGTTASMTQDTSVVITYPLAYVSTPYSILSQAFFTATSATRDVAMEVVQPTNTQFLLYKQCNISGAVNDGPVFWMSVGK